MGAICGGGEKLDFSGDIDLRHFELDRNVGEGAFGKVRIIRKKDDNSVYALKYINKIKCVEKRSVKEMLRERKLYEKIHHPLCVNLRYAFQDEENVFIAIDLMLGGDLRYHLGRVPFSEEQIRGYVAEMAVATRALNEKHIIHRDLKPDNVLLDLDGHAHLTDFNIAVKIDESKPETATAGSLPYMAPEIFAKKGYTYSVDWWSIGVIMYEFMYTKRPFDTKNNSELKERIMEGKYKIPTEDKESGRTFNYSTECMDVLAKLLTVDVTMRLGVNAEKYEEFKTYPWFKMTIGKCGPVDFEAVLNKTWTPPFKPDKNGNNFEIGHDIAEAFTADAQLDNSVSASNKKRLDPSRLPKGADSQQAKDLEELETKFKDFNHARDLKKSVIVTEETSKDSYLDKAAVASTTTVQDSSSTSLPKDRAAIANSSTAGTKKPSVAAATSSPTIKEEQVKEMEMDDVTTIKEKRDEAGPEKAKGEA